MSQPSQPPEEKSLVSWSVRPCTEEDLPFIIDSWRKSFIHSPEVDGCTGDLYYPRMLGVIQRLLSRPKAKVLVACPDGENSFFIGGWICFEEGIELSDRGQPFSGAKIHYVFSREKGLGMWKLLVRAHGLENVPAIYTSWTKAMKRVSLPHLWRYDPFDKWEKEQT